MAPCTYLPPLEVTFIMVVHVVACALQQWEVDPKAHFVDVRKQPDLLHGVQPGVFRCSSCDSTLQGCNFHCSKGRLPLRRGWATFGGQGLVGLCLDAMQLGF